MSTTVTGPLGCAAAEVAEYTPLAGTGTLTIVPSGNVTFTVEPGSAVPPTVMVPLGLAVVKAEGVTSAVASTKVPVATGERLPAGSVAVAETTPELCGVAEVTLYWPLAGTRAVPVVPSGNVTFTVDPGSAMPATVTVPFGLALDVKVGTAGGVASVMLLEAVGDRLPAASFATAVAGPDPCGVADVAE